MQNTLGDCSRAKKVLDEARNQFNCRGAGEENGTIEAASIAVKGKNADLFVKSWIGTIQWIGQSQFRKMHKKQKRCMSVHRFLFHFCH